MKVSAQYAEEHFTDLLHAADNGEEVEIARADQPTYRLELVKSTTKAILSGPRRELLGAWEGLVKAPTEEEWRSIKKDFAESMPDFSPRTDEAA
jgi:antitoxin (DNA-binding transcriptional repressor) of toxin-antitoxin stability system